MTPVPPPPLPAAAATVGFDGAVLGEPLDLFRARTPGADARCGPAGPGEVRCVLADMPLGGGYRARGVTLRFTGGQLRAIEFLTSVNGLPWVTARFRRAWGDPREVVRDRREVLDGLVFPHLRMVWRVGAARILIDDPTRCGVTLRVRLSLGDAAGPRGGEGACAALL